MAGSIMLRMPASPDGRQAFALKTLVDLVPSDTLGDGCAYATDPGLAVLALKFQDGPIAEAGANGCQIEDVLNVLVERLLAFQDGPFPCPENAAALEHLALARSALTTRTLRRRAEGVEGRSVPHTAAPAAEVAR